MKRNNALDIAKGIGMYLVILAHTCSKSNVVNLIYLFHMPLFFFVSGMITYYSNKEIAFKDFFKKKIKSLIVPYLFFFIFSFLYWYIIERKIRNQINISALDVFLNIFICKADESLYLHNVVLWFLPCMFVTEMLFYYIIKLKKQKIIFVIAFIIGYILNVNNIILPFCLETSLITIIFMYIGYLYSQKMEKTRRNKIISIILCIISIVGIMLCMHFKQKTNLLNHQYGNLILFFVGSFSGINIILQISDFINKMFVKRISKLLSYFGKSSLIIMLCHEPIKRIILKIISIVFGITVEVLRKNFIYSNIITILILVSMIPIAFIINNYLAIIIGKNNIKVH